MPLDPSIPLQGKAPQIETPDFASTVGNAYKLKAAKFEIAKAETEDQYRLLSQATPQNYDAIRAQAVQKYGEEAAQRLPPVYDKAAIDNLGMSLLSTKDKLDLAQKSWDREMETQKFTETQRHNKATESTAQDRADISNSMADLKMKMLESGQLGLKDRVGVEKTLRDDFQTQSKDWGTVANFYQRGLEGKKAADAGNPQGDQTLIYSFMKLQDPTSVVMPGEYATAGQFKGVSDALIQQYNKALKGDALSKNQRENITQQLEAIFRAKANQQVGNESSYRELAERSNADPRSVMIGVPSVTQISPTWPTAAPNPQARVGVQPPPMRGTVDNTPTTPQSQLLPPPNLGTPQAAQIKAAYQSGQMSKEQAKAALQALGGQ